MMTALRPFHDPANLAHATHPYAHRRMRIVHQEGGRAQLAITPSPSKHAPPTTGASFLVILGCPTMIGS